MREVEAVAAGHYDSQVALVAMIGLSLAGQPIPPNPHRGGDEPATAAKSPERIAAENKVGWAMLDKFFQGK